MKRTPMSRGTGFKRPERVRQPMAPPTPIRRGVVVACTGMAQASPKENPLRSEAYRRLVAMLPCAICHIDGLSQAAHPPPTGKGIKEDDRMCFPLCCARPGVEGCHFRYDQGRLFSRERMRAMAGIWAQETREIIEGNGMWPKGLPLWAEK